jgi:hypothetical protein
MPTTPTNDDDLQILTDVLARADALWSHPRCLSRNAWAALAEQRAAFDADGIYLRVSGAADKRKSAERRLSDLEAAGVLTIAARAGRRVGVKLTRRGDDVARWFAAAPMLYQSWPLLQRMAALVAAGVSMGPLVAETDLAAVDYDGGEGPASAALNLLELDLLAPKAAGLVEDHADAHGRVYLGLTPAGRRAVAGKPMAKPKGLPEYRTGWSDRHDALYRRYLAEREEATPKNINLVIVPLSCAMGPAKSWRDIEQVAGGSSARKTVTRKQSPQNRARNPRAEGSEGPADTTGPDDA